MPEPTEAHIDPFVAEELAKPTESQIHFSDVLPEQPPGDDREDEWWQATDFDSGLTIQAESAAFPRVAQIPTRNRPEIARYGLLLVDDLVTDNRARVRTDLHRYADVPDEDLHPDVLQERQRILDGAIAVVANTAPRVDEVSKEGLANGDDFALLVTFSGMLAYVTRPEVAQHLNDRHRIRAAYRIPTLTHPEFDGDREQFRSARIVRTNRHPDHLETVFEYGSPDEVISAKRDGDHPEFVPPNHKSGEIMLVDAFGNVIFSKTDARGLPVRDIGRTAAFLVRQDGKEVEIGATVVDNLKSAPSDTPIVYTNKSTPNGETDTVPTAATIEFTQRPSTRAHGGEQWTDTGIHVLREHVPDLDIARAEVDLIFD